MKFKLSETDGGNLYDVEIETLEDLKNLQRRLTEFERGLEGFDKTAQPCTLIVDFENMTIEFYNYYRE